MAETDLKHLMADVLQVPRETVTDDLTMAALGTWDSMVHMMLITRLEEAYAIRLEAAEIADMTSMTEIRRVLARHGVDGAAG